MQRCAQAVLDHALRREVGERRVQLLELVEVVEHGLGHGVHRVGRGLARRHHRGEHAVGVGGLRVVRVQAGGDGDLGVIGLVGHQLVHHRAGERHQLGAAGGGGVLDVGAGVAHAVEEPVHLAVAQGRTVLVGLQFGSEREIRELPTHGREHFFHRRARSRAGIAHVEALALEVLELGDVGLLAGHHGEGLGVHGKHGAQVPHGTGVLELADALDGVELHVRLGEAEVELAGLDGVHVEHRTPGGFDRAADTVLGAVLVDQAADGAAGRVVHAGDAAGADGHEFLLRHGRGAGNGCRQGGGGGQCVENEFRGHVHFSFRMVRGQGDVDAMAAVMAASSRSVIRANSVSVAMKGGASSTWSP